MPHLSEKFSKPLEAVSAIKEAPMDITAPVLSPFKILKSPMTAPAKATTSATGLATFAVLSKIFRTAVLNSTVSLSGLKLLGRSLAIAAIIEQITCHVKSEDFPGCII